MFDEMINEKDYIGDTEKMADSLLLKIHDLLTIPDDLSSDEVDDLIEKCFIQKEHVKQRKHIFLETLSPHKRHELALKHPVWILQFDLFYNQFTTEYFVDNNHFFIRCTLEPDLIRCLNIYLYSGGNILRINSGKDVTMLYKEDSFADSINLQWHRMRVITNKSEALFSGGFICRDFGSYKHQWIFMGERWTVQDGKLFLDFGDQQADAVKFLELSKNK